jgi:hypothetical protein
VLCCAVLCCAVLCCAVLCCAVLCCAVLCCAVLCCAVLYCAVLCCAVLCCVVLYCVVLCCVVLCPFNQLLVLCCTVRSAGKCVCKSRKANAFRCATVYVSVAAVRQPHVIDGMSLFRQQHSLQLIRFHMQTTKFNDCVTLNSARSQRQQTHSNKSMYAQIRLPCDHRALPMNAHNNHDPNPAHSLFVTCYSPR